MKEYDEWVIWLKITHGISPTSLYMGVNEIRELIQIRNETLSPRWRKSLYPLTFTEWLSHREVMIKRDLPKHKMI